MREPNFNITFYCVKRGGDENNKVVLLVQIVKDFMFD